MNSTFYRRDTAALVYCCCCCKMSRLATVGLAPCCSWRRPAQRTGPVENFPIKDQSLLQDFHKSFASYVSPCYLNIPVINELRKHYFQDFPFFRQHKQTKGTITMENGDMAAVCLDCFENLKNQFMEVRHYCVLTFFSFPQGGHGTLHALTPLQLQPFLALAEILYCCHFQAAKYGIPVDKRQYNWMQVPPPPEDGVQLITPKERLDKHIVSV